MDASPRAVPDTGEGIAPTTSRVAREAAELIEQLLGELADRVVLLQLELRRATGALAVVLALALAGAILIATAWVALCGATAWFAMQRGADPYAATAVVVALNLVLCFAALRLALRLLRSIGVPLTVRHLTHRASRDADSAPAQARWAP